MQPCDATLSWGRGLPSDDGTAPDERVRCPLTCPARVANAALLHSSPPGEECFALSHDAPSLLLERREQRAAFFARAGLPIGGEAHADLAQLLGQLRARRFDPHAVLA